MSEENSMADAELPLSEQVRIAFNSADQITKHVHASFRTAGTTRQSLLALAASLEKMTSQPIPDQLRKGVIEHLASAIQSIELRESQAADLMDITSQLSRALHRVIAAIKERGISLEDLD